MATVGLRGVGTFCSLDLTPCDYCLFTLVKEHLWGKQFESEDNINIAVTASLHYLSKVECRAAIDRLPHRWKKCVDSAGDYIQWMMCANIEEYQ